MGISLFDCVFHNYLMIVTFSIFQLLNIYFFHYLCLE